jgi:hypothetical protein
LASKNSKTPFHFEQIPHGTISSFSKCMGVLLFLLANNANPIIMNFKKKDINNFIKQVNPSNLRLDEDEKNHSFYLIKNKDKISIFKPIDHVEKIHIDKYTCNTNLIPEYLREKLMEIIKNYTKGKCELKNKEWIAST